MDDKFFLPFHIAQLQGEGSNETYSWVYLFVRYSLSRAYRELQNCPHYAGEGTTTYTFTNTEIVCWIQYDQFDGDDEINLLHLDGSFSFLQREEGFTAPPLWTYLSYLRM